MFFRLMEWKRDGQEMGRAKEEWRGGGLRLVTAQSFRDMTKSNVLFIARIFRVLVILVRGLLMLLCVGYFYDGQRADMAAQLSEEGHVVGGSSFSTYSP